MKDDNLFIALAHFFFDFSHQRFQHDMCLDISFLSCQVWLFSFLELMTTMLALMRGALGLGALGLGQALNDLGDGAGISDCCRLYFNEVSKRRLPFP